MLCEPKLSIKPVYLSSSTRSQYLLPHATFYSIYAVGVHIYKLCIRVWNVLIYQR